MSYEKKYMLCKLGNLNVIISSLYRT